jgi:hypothetical protein
VALKEVFLKTDEALRAGEAKPAVSTRCLSPELG